MSQPELKPEEIIIALQARLRELEAENANLKKENESLKTSLHAYKSQGKNYPSSVTVRTGHL